MKRDCPCEYCECNTTSYGKRIDPCGYCLMHHPEYDNYQEGLGIEENREWGNIK